MTRRARGNITKRGNVWILRVGDGHKANGERRVRCRVVRVPTKKQAERELTKFLREVDLGTVGDAGDLKLRDYIIKDYLPDARARLRGRTVDRYDQLIRLHVLPVIGSLKLSSLRPTHVRAVVRAMGEAGLSASTTTQAYRVLSAALREAVQLGLIPTNPALGVKPPRADRPTLAIPDGEAVRQLLQASENHSLHLPLLLAATTGARRGEILALRWHDLDLEAATVRIVRAAQRSGGDVVFVEPKTDRGRRSVTIPPSVVEALKRRRTEQVERRLVCGEGWQDLDLVIDRGDGGAVHPDVFSRSFKRLADRLGMPDMRLHDLRHFHASSLISSGVDPLTVSRRLGHANAGFTLNVYGHVYSKSQKEAALRIEEALTL